MTRSYRHIQEYEKEILKLKEQGLTQQEIANKLGFKKEQVKGFFKRYNKKQRKLAAGTEIRPKGRPPKTGAPLPPSVQQLSKVTQLQYELASKDRYIKHLEMENELMRDFLSLTEKE